MAAWTDKLNSAWRRKSSKPGTGKFHGTTRNDGERTSGEQQLETYSDLLTGTLDWSSDQILVFFFITVLVVNSESLRVNSSPSALGAQSSGLFKLIFCPETWHLCASTSRQMSTESRGIKWTKGEITHNFTPARFSQLPLQIHYSHTYRSTFCSCIFLKIHTKKSF